MRRVQKYKTANSGNRGAPQRWVIFDTETGTEPVDPDDNTLMKHKLKLGAAIYVRTDTPSGVPIEEKFEFTKINEFFDWMMTKTQNGKALTVVAHNINFDLTVMEWHKKMYNEYGWGVEGRSILPDGSPIPFVVDWRPMDQIGKPKLKSKKKITFLDLSNYFGMTPLSTIGKSVGIAKMNDVVDYKKEPERWLGAQPGTPDWEILKTYCMRDVEVTKQAIFTFIEFIKTHRLGSFAISAAGQAMNAYTHRFMPTESIHIHNDVKAMRLERESYMGARVEVLQKQGHVEGPILEADINSMYPAVMHKYPLPWKLYRYRIGEQARREMPITKMMELIKDGWCLVARVQVNVPMFQEPVIPIRRDGKLIYATGSFEAVLTTPELHKLAQLGYITEVSEYGLYYGRTDLFKGFVDFFYNKRQEYKASGNEAFGAMSKLMLNSLYGKFGQYTYEWLEVPDEDMEFMEFIELKPGSIKSIKNADTGEIMKYRNIGGKIEYRNNVKVEPSEGFCAIASHIIAYGRVYLSELIELAGGRANVVYCDTDSLHLTNDGADRLEKAGLLHNVTLGMLKLEAHVCDEDGKPIYESNGRPRASEWGNYRGAKDYDLQGKGNKTKGIRKGSPEIAKGVYRVEQFRGFQGGLHDGDLNTMVMATRTKTITGKYTKAFVDPDTGKITPFHITD